MKITVCIGSSCHLKGSRQVVEQLQSIVAERDLKDKIELCGAFCMENCTNGVCVKIDEEMFSLKPENTKSFFENEVLKRLSRHTD
jgi:NADH:ubiquinone oxidoreductase subunit E